MGCRYAGIDWATEKHDVRVADETGEKLLRRRLHTTRPGCWRCAGRW
jgi:hypothetical protein